MSYIILYICFLWQPNTALWLFQPSPIAVPVVHPPFITSPGVGEPLPRGDSQSAMILEL